MISCTVLIACIVTAIIVITFGYGSICVNNTVDSKIESAGMWSAQKKNDNKDAAAAVSETNLSKNLSVESIKLEFLTDMLNSETSRNFTLMIHSERCPWCKKMMTTFETLVNEGKEVLGEKVYTLEVSPELRTATGKIQTIMKNVKGLPTIFTISKTNSTTTAKVFSGFVQPDMYEKRISSANNIEL